MKFKEFVKLYCERGTTPDEHYLYWYYFRLGAEWIGVEE